MVKKIKSSKNEKLAPATFEAKQKDTKVYLPLEKGTEKYKITIPENVEEKIRYFCNKIHDIEWSGILFYDVNGTFEHNDLNIICKDIYLMDIGSSAFTEFEMSPEVISYMARHSALLQCKTGLIHSHNNMATFFSGTDTSTLQMEGTDRNHFVSLIVNNAGSYTAGITKQVTYTKHISELSNWSTFGGEPTITQKEYQTTDKKIMWYELEIEKAEINDPHQDLAERIEAIKQKKTTSTSAYKWENKFKSPNNSFKFSEQMKTGTDPLESRHNHNFCTQGNLFKDPIDDSWDWWGDDYNPNWKGDKSLGAQSLTDPTTVPYAGKYSQIIIERAAKQIVTGNYILANEKTMNLQKWAENMKDHYQNRFGSLKVKSNKDAFETWAELYVEYVLTNDLDPAFVGVDDDMELSTKAFEIICMLQTLKQNEYLQIYIDILNNYIL